MTTVSAAMPRSGSPPMKFPERRRFTAMSPSASAVSWGGRDDSARRAQFSARRRVGTFMEDGASLYGRLSVAGAAATDHARWRSLDAVRALAALMVLASHAYLLGGRVHPSGGAIARSTAALADGVWLF